MASFIAGVACWDQWEASFATEAASFIAEGASVEVSRVEASFDLAVVVQVAAITIAFILTAIV